MNVFQAVGSVVLAPVKFVQQVVTELKLVTWPTRADTIRSTLIVIAISLGVGVYVAGLDVLFTKGIELLFSVQQ